MSELRSLKDIAGYSLLAEDGEIGRCRDFLFDDAEWIVRWLVADTGKWIPRRKVLLAPDFLGDADWAAKKLPVKLTKHEIEQAPSLDEAAVEGAPSEAEDPHLRSLDEVEGYDIQATDGEVGHVEDLIVDDEDWTIRYFVVDTRDWLPGRKVLVSPAWLRELVWSDRRAVVDLTREQIEESPRYEPREPIYRAYEAELHEGYGHKGYWEP